MAHTETSAALSVAEAIKRNPAGLDRLLDAIHAIQAREPDRRLQAVPCDDDAGDRYAVEQRPDRFEVE